MGNCKKNITLWALALLLLAGLHGLHVLAHTEAPLQIYSNPVLIADTTTACQGDSITLRLQGGGAFELSRNGSTLGWYADSLRVGLSGSYTATTHSPTDTLTSAPLLINFLLRPNAGFITPADTQLLCPGHTFTVVANRPGFWFANHTNLNNSSTQLAVSTTGLYYRVLTNGFCADTTAPLLVLPTTNPQAGQLWPTDTVQICQGESLPIAANAFGYWHRNGANLNTHTDTLWATQAATYYRVAGLGSCADTTTALLLQVLPPQNAGLLSATQPDTLCQGDSLLLATNGTGTWHANGTPLNTTADTLYAKQTATYYRVAGGTFCTDTSNSVSLTVVPRPTASLLNATDTTIICQGDTATLRANQMGSWYANGQPIFSQADSLRVFQAGVAYYMVVNNGHCADTSQTVWVQALPRQLTGPILPVGQQVVCPNDSLLLFSPGVGTWYFNGNSMGIQTDSIFIKQAGYYHRQSQGQCPDSSDTLQVLMPLTDSLRVRLSQQATCRGDSFVVQANGGFDTYNWVLNGTLLQSGSDSTLTTTQEGQLIGTASVANNACPTKPDTLWLAPTDTTTNYPPLPDRLICLGNTITLIAPDSQALAYYWNQQLGGASYSTNQPQRVVLQMQTACTNHFDTININPKPTEQLPEQLVLLCAGSSATLTATLPGSNHQWNTGATTPSITATPTNTYSVAYTDTANCPITQTYRVEEDNCPQPLLVADAFSPNGDGANETFTVRCGSCTEYEIRVFNRWGEMVFYSQSLNEHWNGNNRNQPCPMGDYYYQIKYTMPSEGSQTKTGYLQLVR